MKKLSLFMMALLFVILSVGVSCSPESAATTNQTVNIKFDIDMKDASGINYSSIVQTSRQNCYWAYSAVKKDNLGKVGETKGFVNCSEGSGLGNAREFSVGTWEFTLKMYSTAADRAAGAPINPWKVGGIETKWKSMLSKDGVLTCNLLNSTAAFTGTTF